MHMLKYILSPLICALIGWLTNYLAVKMLFHPREPKRFLLFKFQGVFPKRRKALAENLGQVIESELISGKDIAEHLSDPALKTRFVDMIREYVERLVEEKADSSSLLSMILNPAMREKITGMLCSDMDRLVEQLLGELVKEVDQKVDFKEVVRSKIESYSMEKIETILFSIMRKEFRYIEILGGVLGFIIGLFQTLLFLV